VTLEYSLPKERYERRVANIVENTKLDRKEVIVPKEVREETEQKKAKEEEWRKKIGISLTILHKRISRVSSLVLVPSSTLSCARPKLRRAPRSTRALAL
jgi:hypothetical protein